jgi:FAD/FMN-containing dehydrogenase/Fe-S oxidoreductase
MCGQVRLTRGASGGMVRRFMQATAPHREIPFNSTSADDRQLVEALLGPEAWTHLDALRERRVTGRSARLLLRFLGDIAVHRRNPFLLEELVHSPRRRKRLFRGAARDLDVVLQGAAGEEAVVEVIAACRKLLATFRAEVEETPARRRRLVGALGAIVGRENVLLDPFTIVSHATDATDWRLHLPVAVTMPELEDQVAPLLAAIAALGLHAIPRGGGTGLTGGAIPLHPRCVVVNTEKLHRIRGIRTRAIPQADGGVLHAEVMEVEAGVVTEKAMEAAEERGLVFATDPTSAWACTIGGNIAENAGGKDCVLWGTCLDNLLSWRMAMPSGRSWTIARLGHPLRKILPDDLVRFEVRDADGAIVRTVALRGDEIRKKGLWKDITNKSLQGLPGVQKEGTDGVVTSAEFVLHRAWPATRTLCLEFFGPDFDEASRVIVELSRQFPFPNDGRVALLALEHFDDEYVRAIAYRVKSARAETPRAVLLVDVVGSDAAEAERGLERIRAILATHPNTELFPAHDPAEAKRFWADRKKLGAIARRTNAFKLNEDVVLPLDALAEFARWVDARNVVEERFAQEKFVAQAEVLLGDAAARSEDPDWLATKLPLADARCAAARATLASTDAIALRALTVLERLRHDLGELVRGEDALLAALDRAHAEARDRRIVLATHMHAGDGNVHVNIPVLSNDRPMLRRAEEVVDAVMAMVVSLGGVVSGEHGIGVTKLKYLEPERIEELRAWRKEVDPGGLMNPGKLDDLAALGRIFTPSFNLLGIEARILQHGQLEELAKAVAGCVRCGKCKPDCCVYHPARGMFFHPRNKNLAVGALIEALLYDAQRERSASFELLGWLREIADHCTICHKCLKPCPVGIDSGEVSILERSLLAARGEGRTAAATSLTLRYLESRSPVMNAAFRTSVVRLGGAIQRAACAVAAPLQPDTATGPGALTMLRSPLPPVPAETLRDLVPACGPDQALVFEPEGVPAAKSVLYFPGCGSERLRSEVSAAALHVLLATGTRVILPPPFLCCGFPAHANAKEDQHARIVLRDTILLSQIREMFGYLEFDACVVTCGTCREGLHGMEIGKLFGGRIVDLAAYALERGLTMGCSPKPEGSVLYHPPCHDSLDGRAREVLGRIGGFGKVETVPHCCSEAGTLALSRPDITDAMLHRKRGAFAEALADRPAGATVLTNCPSCLQGLGRNAALGVAPKHLAVALAEGVSGPGWLDLFRARAARAQVIHF